MKFNLGSMDIPDILTRQEFQRLVLHRLLTEGVDHSTFKALFAAHMKVYRADKPGLRVVNAFEHFSDRRIPIRRASSADSADNHSDDEEILLIRHLLLVPITPQCRRGRTIPQDQKVCAWVTISHLPRAMKRSSITLIRDQS